MRSYDQLNEPLKTHYVKKMDGIYNGDEAEVRLKIMTAQREGIQEGLKWSYIRRTYHREYVTSKGKEKYIGTVDQINGREEVLDVSYYADEDGFNEVIPFIVQLPARKGVENWVYGYRYSAWDGEVLFLEVNDKSDAIHWAKHEAEKHAEKLYEEDCEYREQQYIEDLFECLKRYRTDIRELIKAYRVTGINAVLKALKDKLMRRRETQEELIERGAL